MKLCEIRGNIFEDFKSVGKNKFVAYHVTNSFHIVKKIFEEGFKDTSGLRGDTARGDMAPGSRGAYLCVSDLDNIWKEFGFYVIKLIVKGKQVSDDDPLKRHYNVETNVPLENTEPIGWGLTFPDEVMWIKEKPKNFDFNKYDKYVSKKLSKDIKLAKSWWEKERAERNLEAWEKDKKSDDTDARAIESLFERGYTYHEANKKYDDKSGIKIVKDLLSKYKNNVDAWMASDMSIAEFRFHKSNLDTYDNELRRRFEDIKKQEKESYKEYLKHKFGILDFKYNDKSGSKVVKYLVSKYKNKLLDAWLASDMSKDEFRYHLTTAYGSDKK
jgi:hypothetical protein